MAAMIADISITEGSETVALNLVSWGGGIVYVFWVLSIGLSSNMTLGKELKKSPALYLACIITILISIILEQFFPTRGVEHTPMWFNVMFMPLFFSIAYIFWFTAKQFVTLEKNEEVKFRQYIGALLCLVYVFIGVWFLQPRVQANFKYKRYNHGFQGTR